jgi:hypothetical protein
MGSKKSKRLLSVDFLDTQAEQATLARYLKSSPVDAKTQVISATTGYFYALALAKQPNIPRAELEMVLSQSVRNLYGQIANIVDYYKIIHQIELPSNSSPRLLEVDLPRQPKMFSSTPLNQDSQNSAVDSGSISSQPIDRGENDDEDDDDDWDNLPTITDVGFDMGLEE